MVAPKGGGAENMIRMKMLKPSDGVEGIKRLVLETVSEAGSNPCPPIILGVGIGGTFEKTALISKKALFRALGTPHPDADMAALEKDLLQAVNALGIGPMGMGGKVTALAVHVETFACHIRQPAGGSGASTVTPIATKRGSFEGKGHGQDRSDIRKAMGGARNRWQM